MAFGCTLLRDPQLPTLRAFATAVLACSLAEHVFVFGLSAVDVVLMVD